MQEKTPAQIFADQILKKANTDPSGDYLVSIPDLTTLIPRGKYSFDIYDNFFKLAGKTHSYKIKHSQVN